MMPKDDGSVLPIRAETSPDAVSFTALEVERSRLDEEAVIALVEERLAVSKRQVVSGTVRIGTFTESHDEIAEIELDRYRVEVVHVPVGRIVEVAPVARAEGDTTIVPVVEERYVIVKQLFLKEELHIRHVVEREVHQEAVALRRQQVRIERVAPDGHVIMIPASDDLL